MRKSRFVYVFHTAVCCVKRVHKTRFSHKTKQFQQTDEHLDSIIIA